MYGINSFRIHSANKKLSIGEIKTYPDKQCGVGIEVVF